MPPASHSLPPVSPMSVGHRSIASALNASKRSVGSNGGFNGGSNLSVVSSANSHHSHNSNSNPCMEWKHLQPCSVARQDMASTCVKNPKNGNTMGMLVVGGRSTEEAALSNTQLFDWSSKRWRPLPPLRSARCGCAVASIGKTFYVFGGTGSSEEGDAASSSNQASAQQAGEAAPSVGGVDTGTSVETFTMGCKAWTTLDSKMEQARWHPSAVALEDGIIVVLGGRDPDQWTELDCAVKFDTSTASFEELPKMNSPRFACGATQIGAHTLFVAGGYDGSEWTSSCEIYDAKENEWSSAGSINEMPVKDLEFVSASSLCEDFLLVSGQRSDVEEGSVVVMVYQISRNEWTVLQVFPPSVADELAGSTMTCVDSKYILAVGGTDTEGLATKNTRTTSNLLDVIHKALNVPSHFALPQIKSLMDDCTVVTYNSKATSQAGNNNRSVPAAPQDTSHGAYSPSGPSLKKPFVDAERMMMSPYHKQPVKHIDIIASGSNSMSSGMSELDASSGHLEEDHSEFALHSMDPLLSPRRGSDHRSTGGSSSRSGKRQSVHDFEMVDTNGSVVIYTGGMVKGKPYGRGRMSWENGDCYTGGFKHGQRHGKGTQSFADGKQYEGRFMANSAHDPNGNMTFNDGTIYVGAFVQGRRTGMGIQRFPSGVRYEGEFVNGKYHGNGSCCFADGSIYEGEWIHGTAHGSGTLKDNRGAILFSGMWQNDSPVEE
ncbi:MAG: hypothetical protein SGILL_004842 [Bacillariaceae sp.]